MKAAELLSLLTQVSDVKAYLEVYMASPDFDKDKDSVRQESQQINQVFNELRQICHEVLKDSKAQNPFDVEVAFPDARALKVIATAGSLLKGLMTIPSVKEHIVKIILIRSKFFEYLETEKKQDSLCHQIDKAKVKLLTEALENHYYGDPIYLAKVTRLAPYLHIYEKAKSKLEIDVEAALGFAEDPFSMVHFLDKKLALESQNDYVLLEKSTIDFAALYRLVTTAVTEMKTLKKNPTVLKELEPLQVALAVPFQRLERCPLFFKEVLKTNKLLEVADFYEKHASDHNPQIKIIIGKVQKVVANMESNVERVVLTLAQHESHQKIVDAKEQRENLLKIRAALDKKRTVSPKNESANNGEARHVGLLTYSNGANSKMLQAAHHKDNATVIREIEAGADINGRDSGLIWGNYSALIIGAYNNDVRLVIALLSIALKEKPKKHEASEEKAQDKRKKPKREKALDVRAQTGATGHDSALHWAVRLNHLEIVEILTVVDPESTLVKSHKMGHNGFIPLHTAITAGKEEAGIILLKEGSIDQILTKNAEGVTPLRMAYDKGQKKLVQRMVNMLLSSCHPDHQKALTEFSKHVFGKGKEKKYIGFLYNTVDPKELRLLEAADSGGVAVIEQASDEKVNINCFDVSEQYPGYTPLMLACSSGHTQTIIALLRANAKVGAQAVLGETALHIAVTPSPRVDVKKSREIVQALVRADSTALTIHENKKGYTPLHAAIESKANRAILAELLTYHDTVLNGEAPLSEQERLRKQQHDEQMKQQLRKMNKIQLRETTKDGVTTPFRLACTLGNVEAARMIFETTLKTEDQALILHALGYCVLRQKFVQFKAFDQKASKELLRQLDQASAEEIIVLASLFRYGQDNSVLTSLANYHRTYIDNPTLNLFGILQGFDSKQTHSLLGYDGPSILPTITLNGMLIKCIAGCPEVGRTWFHAKEVANHLGSALSYGQEQKPAQAQRQLHSSFWASPAQKDDPMEQFMLELISKYLPAQDIKKASPPRIA